MKHLEVVAAILEYDGKILCMERGQGKFEYVSFKYEFPGGKIEPGEKKHEAMNENCGKRWTSTFRSGKKTCI